MSRAVRRPVLGLLGAAALIALPLLVQAKDSASPKPQAEVEAPPKPNDLLKGLETSGPGWSYTVRNDKPAPALVFQFFGSEAEQVEALNQSDDKGSATFTSLVQDESGTAHGYWAGWTLSGYFGRGVYLYGNKEGRWVEGDTSGDVAQGLGYYLSGKREGAWNFYGVDGLFLRSELYSAGEIKFSFTRPADCKSFPLCYQWAEELVEIGEGRAALHWFQRALAQSTHQIHSHTKLAELYDQLGELDDSENQCDLLLALSPSNAFAKKQKGVLADKRTERPKTPFTLKRD